MTLAERARQIDREEFAAECAAIRQRAYARLGLKRSDERVERWINRIEPKGTIVPKHHRNAVKKAARTHAANAKFYEAFGHKRTLNEWAAETGMSPNTIRNRLNLGWPLEDALTRPVQEHRKQEITA